MRVQVYIFELLFLKSFILTLGPIQHECSAVTWSDRIHRLYLCRSVSPFNECPGYDTKLSDSEASDIELWGMRSTSPLLLLPGPPCLGVEVHVRALTMGQIELFSYLLYLKPFLTVLKGFVINSVCCCRYA